MSDLYNVASSRDAHPWSSQIHAPPGQRIHSQSFYKGRCGKWESFGSTNFGPVNSSPIFWVQLTYPQKLWAIYSIFLDTLGLPEPGQPLGQLVLLCRGLHQQTKKVKEGTCSSPDTLWCVCNFNNEHKMRLSSSLTWVDCPMVALCAPGSSIFSSRPACKITYQWQKGWYWKQWWHWWWQ